MEPSGGASESEGAVQRSSRIVAVISLAVVFVLLVLGTTKARFMPGRRGYLTINPAAPLAILGAVETSKSPTI